MSNISDQTQLAALDAIIAALRRRMLPPARECDLLGDQLGAVRDRVARAMAAAREGRGSHNDRRRER